MDSTGEMGINETQLGLYNIGVGLIGFCGWSLLLYYVSLSYIYDWRPLSMFFNLHGEGLFELILCASLSVICIVGVVLQCSRKSKNKRNKAS